jgi:uncharacterized protein (TIGR01319 family)
MNAIMLIDFGSTFTKVCAVDMDAEMVLATAQAPTTINDDICNGLNNATKKLETQIGSISYSKKLACSSAAGGLTVMASGLVRSLTVKAARLAALGAGAKVIKSFDHELTNSDINLIKNNTPDIFLLAGGTDGGNQKVILHNAKQIASIDNQFPVVIAGNRAVCDEASDIVSASGKKVYPCPNIMPDIDTLNIDPVNKVIRELFIAQITKAKGISRAESIIDSVLVPTPYAVLMAAELLADGTKSQKGMGELMIFDIGGATTDVHSVCDGYVSSNDVVLRGFIEPRVKRSVEGDIGVRFNAHSLVDLANEEAIDTFSSISEEKVVSLLERIKKNPSTLLDGESTEFDTALSRLAIKLASIRHCGTYEKHFTPHGIRYLQTGKDFTNIKTIIGTGGPLVNGACPKELLNQALFDESELQSLRPKKPDFYLDKKYILSAMGLLSTIDRDKALSIMKKNIKAI